MNKLGECPKCLKWNEDWSFINTCESCGQKWIVSAFETENGLEMSRKILLESEYELYGIKSGTNIEYI